MPEKLPISQDQLQAFYIRIAKTLETSDGREAHFAVVNFNTNLYRDMRSEAEVRMLMYGRGASDRFLFGLCSAVIAMREENGGNLPVLTDDRYEFDKETQDRHEAAQDQLSRAYFEAIEINFENRFPLTRTMLAAQDYDLRNGLGAAEIDVEEGFIPGWYKAVKTVMPLFAEQGKDAGSPRQ